MIKYEDRMFEKFSLGKDGEFAVPVTLSISKNGVVTAVTYRKTKRIVKRFLKAHGDDILSQEPITELKAELDSVMKKYSYEYDDSSEAILEFEMTSPSDHDGAETVILKTCEEISRYPADTTLWNLEVDDKDDLDVICAVIQNGRLAAFASVNDMAEDGGLEINVECAPNHRRQGFGSSCAAGLANYLISEAKVSKVCYKCREKNKASEMTARRAGFIFTRRRFTFVYRRKNNKSP